VVKRLTRRSEFLYVAKGAKHVAPSVMVQARASSKAGTGARTGFTATKKIGNAVIRNRAKRRLREAARLLVPVLGHPGTDYVFVARRDTGARVWADLLDDIKTALISLAPAASDSAGGQSPAPE